MNIKNSMVSKIFKGISFSPHEISLIEQQIEKIELKKGDTLLRANETILHQYYVDEGCLRTYFIDQSGKEHTLQFAINDWWISDYTAFFTTTTSIMNIECIQDAILYKISKQSMESLFLEIPPLETFFRKKMEGAFASFQKRILASLAQPAKKRYLSFIKSYPNIEQSVKNYHIASYLGITTESLSRIRKESLEK
ncbi:Crp/Fnr family transcriptional regulator [Mesonia aestuariivivens]|uniref:Crp/Fnr family transcriptional regulator n=1 Tax=Mesonia aestuariivivens TaxID=2796128 RepID=A0ABS6W310_9FLAO|nr:Crp/Fnr family transcriptional regulator [Mesonia aestuariivivens]MBW2962104.1 Crp/Fnr family transcriptional regulator [Mesonia aestuariivivens]